MIWVSLDNLIELHDVRMTNEFQNLYLSSDSLYVAFILDLFFLENLHSNSFFGGHVQSELDLSEGTFSEFIAWLIGVYRCRNFR